MFCLPSPLACLQGKGLLTERCGLRFSLLVALVLRSNRGGHREPLPQRPRLGGEGRRAECLWEGPAGFRERLPRLQVGHPRDHSSEELSLLGI